MSEGDLANGPSCPIPIDQYPSVQMAHGGGGALMHQLIEKMFVTAFRNELLEARHDGAVFGVEQGRLAFTTDSYVVNPLSFPGGDIGSLAVYGTVNDLAMCGARPLYLSAGFILEEGLAMEILWRVVQSMSRAALEADVRIVTGDTKVVDRGKGDGVFINTAGVGVMEHDREIGPASVVPGDKVLLSGDVGRHGIAIMAEREGLNFETKIKSDSADVSGLVMALLESGIEVHCLRDLTRGGLATALVEIANASGVHIQMDETSVQTLPEVQGACELLGLDPLYVANEGRFVAFIASGHAEKALSIMRSHSQSEGAVILGEVQEKTSGEARGLVRMRSRIGASRILDLLSGEQLPRIC